MSQSVEKRLRLAGWTRKKGNFALRGESHSMDPHDRFGRMNGSPRLSRRAGRTVLHSVETETEMSIPACLDKYPNVMWAKECKVGATRVGLVLKREATPRCVSTVKSSSTKVHD